MAGLDFDPKDVLAATLCDIHLMETGETLHPSYILTQFRRLAALCEEVPALRDKLQDKALWRDMEQAIKQPNGYAVPDVVYYPRRVSQ